MHNRWRVGVVLVYDHDRFPAKGADFLQIATGAVSPLRDRGGDLSVGVLDKPWLPSSQSGKNKHRKEVRYGDRM